MPNQRETCERPSHRASEVKADLNNIYGFLGQVSFLILKHEGGDPSDMVDGMSVSSQLHKGWKLFEQRLDYLNPDINKQKDEKHGLKEDALTPNEVARMIAEISKKYDLMLVKGSPHINTISSMIALFGGFKARLEELRCGHLTKRNNVKGSHLDPIAYYSPMVNHGPLLEGIGWPSDIRSSLAEHIGPLTQIIQYLICCKRKDPLRSRLADAFKDSIKQVPNCLVLIEAFNKFEKTSMKHILRLLGDLLLLMGSRPSQKITLPINVLWIGVTASTPTTPEAVTPEQKLMPANITLTGPKAIILYNMMMRRTEIIAGSSMESDTEEDPPATKKSKQMEVFKMKFYDLGIHTAQVVFHCVFGTYRENLNLLSKITNNNHWSQRREMDCFEALATKKRIPVEPIIMHYAYKLGSVNELEFFPVYRRNQTSLPVFSGTHSSYHPNLLENKPPWMVEISYPSRGYSVASILSELHEYIHLARSIAERDRGLSKWSSRKWWKMAEDGNYEDLEEPPAFGPLQERVFMDSEDEIVAAKQSR